MFTRAKCHQQDNRVIPHCVLMPIDIVEDNDKSFVSDEFSAAMLSMTAKLSADDSLAPNVAIKSICVILFCVIVSVSSSN